MNKKKKKNNKKKKVTAKSRHRQISPSPNLAIAQRHVGTKLATSNMNYALMNRYVPTEMHTTAHIVTKLLQGMGTSAGTSLLRGVAQFQTAPYAQD